MPPIRIGDFGVGTPRAAGNLIVNYEADLTRQITGNESSFYERRRVR